MEIQKYKLTLMLKPDISAVQSKKIGERVQTAVKKTGGKILKSESRGIKPLAYQVEGVEQASFGEFLLELPKGKIDSIRREVVQAGGLLRVMMVKIKGG